ncbi:unnamed protein product [Rotaria sp. Silwood2]|nr:unnamed protein product [Rotaria sp. Silwood2]CAF4273056.1 unnamed protein product [Rotaria sp. Silwood2]CAF4290906.1 unnamed protein product [Rotaria sp. Silwood2]
MTCTQCTCAALIAGAVGWNCVTSNGTCQLITNYSLDNGHIVETTNGSFFFQQFPSHLLLTTSDTTAEITSTTTTTTTALDCIASLVGATSLLYLANVSSQSYTKYSYIYTAVTTSTRLTLSFRMDSNNWSLDTISVKKSGTSIELLANGDFHLGNGTGLSSCNPYNATKSGFVINDSLNAQSGSFYWKDGSTGAADYLYYYFPTDIGTNYTVSFYLKSGGGLPNSAHVYIGS